MKRLLIILLIFPAIIQAQSPYPLRGPVHIIYKNGEIQDTTKIYFTTLFQDFYTSKQGFRFNKIVLVNGDTLSTMAYARSVGGGGGGTITSDSLNFSSDLLYWDRPNRTYKAYASKPSVLGIYKAAAFPDLISDTAKLNGILSATQFYIKNNIEGDLYRTNIREDGYFHYFGNTYSWLAYDGLSLSNSTDDVNSHYNYTDINIANSSLDSLYLRLNPFQTNTAVPYVFKSKYKVTGNLLELWQQDRKKISIDSSGAITHKGIFASIYRNGSGVNQSIPTGTTPTKVTAFTTDGYYSNCTPDATNDKITITKTGYYDLTLSLSYSSGSANVTWVAYIFQGGTEVANIHSTGKATIAGDVRSTSISGLLYVNSVPVDIDYRVTHDNGGSVDLNIPYVNMSVKYLGE